MNIAIKTVLITGANRGIGRALVDEALKRGARRVYAAARSPFRVDDRRVTPLVLDVTDRVQIDQAAAAVESLDVLVNNAGVADFADHALQGNLSDHEKTRSKSRSSGDDRDLLQPFFRVELALAGLVPQIAISGTMGGMRISGKMLVAAFLQLTAERQAFCH